MLYAYKVFRLIILAFTITYFLGCTWFFISDGEYHESCKEVNHDIGCWTPPDLPDVIYNNQTWYHKYELEDRGLSGKVVISLYFALTTLSTVGYGDIFPISQFERITAVVVMMLGVAFFSYIMGNFIEIISNIHSKMGGVDRSTELEKWITSLQRFTNF